MEAPSSARSRSDLGPIVCSTGISFTCATCAIGRRNWTEENHWPLLGLPLPLRLGVAVLGGSMDDGRDSHHDPAAFLGGGDYT
jgi:hypothetical protein